MTIPRELMIEKGNGIIFDADYTDGLIAAGLRDGYITMRCESQVDKQLADSYVSRVKHSPFKRKSLELALLFDNVYLHDPYAYTVLDLLQKEDVISGWKLHPAEANAPGQEVSVDYSTAGFLKPLLLDRLAKLIKKLKPGIGAKRGLAKKYVFGLFDFVVLWSAGKHEEAIEEVRPPIASLLHIKKGDPVAYISKLFSDFVETGTAHWFVGDFLAVAFEIESLVSLMEMSKENIIPFATNRITSYKGKQEIEGAHDAYKLCLLPFREEVRYAPVVDSVEDLLRLREKKEIIRFREVLNSWKTTMLDGEVASAERIRADISKANKEIRKLNKWKEVDRWLYYFALPTALVPIVSNLVTVASVCTRRYIEQTERTHGWVAIVR